MSQGAVRRSIIAAATVTTLAVLLTGCIFRPSHGKEIATAAQRAFADAGISGGIEPFNNGEGFGSNYDLLVCVEAPAGTDAPDLAARIADALNALVEVSSHYSSYLSNVQLRLVDENLKARDLDSWCRAEDQNGLLVLDPALPYLSGTEAGDRGTSVTVAVPYDEIVVGPPATPIPTPSPSG